MSKKKVIWNGVEYKTIKEAALANGVGANAMSERLRSGMTCDADLKRKRGLAKKRIGVIR